MTLPARRDRVRAALSDIDGGVDALLVESPANVRWLTGLQASSAALLVGADRDILRTDARYAAEAADLAGSMELVLNRGDGWLGDHLRDVKRVGLEEDRVSWARARALQARLPQAEVVGASGVVDRLRTEKDADERAVLARACQVTAAALADVFEVLAPGLSEHEVARMVEDALRDRGADDRAFATIVASGPNGARPHHRPGSRRLAPGDLVTIDAGALVDGYHADMTRTVALGTADPQLLEVYEAVREAQAAGVAALHAGVEAGAVDDTCRTVLIEAGLESAIGHPCGHGVGLEIHEPPILRSGETARLPAGAVVTVEPGAYVPGLGGVRIEDTVAVTKTGHYVLTAAPTELLTL